MKYKLFQKYFRCSFGHFCFVMVLCANTIIRLSVGVSKGIRDLTILGRQRDGDGQNKLLQINGSKDSSWYIINRMNLIQF
jgi:hypothetical protein